jgi:hypothetical protein
MKNEDKIIVNVQFEETVSYNQDVEMTVKEFNDLLDFDKEDLCCNNDGYDEIRELIDVGDVFDNQGEIRNIKLTKAK